VSSAGQATEIVPIASVPSAVVAGVSAEALVLADFLSKTRRTELEDIAFKRQRGGIALVLTVLMAVGLFYLLPKDIKPVTEICNAFFGVFMSSPLVVGVRPNWNRINAYDAMRQLLLTPGSDQHAIEQARQLVKDIFGGVAK
jgi:hypothetical protein